MIFRNLLATRNGRLATFFFLYVTEGIPLGFTGTAIIAQMSSQGLTASQTSSFFATLYLPWGLKWLVGPVVDMVYWPRIGRRRGWILGTQVLMSLGLIALIPIDFIHQLSLFTFVLFFVNMLGATQDVAIDALACNVLNEQERGLANGLMFAGAYLGQAIGGSGALLIAGHMKFQATFIFVSLCILTITAFVTLPMREQPEAGTHPLHRFKDIQTRIVTYLAEAFRSFFHSRQAVAGLFFALLPTGAYALSLALGTHLAVEFGMSQSDIGLLTLASTITSALGCVAGGFLSDRLGRVRMLAFYIVMTAIPTLLLAWAMQRAGWIWPRTDSIAASHNLMVMFCVVSIVYAIFQGLYYGARTALFMDVSNPAVAATQFTAYMALLNLVISYSSFWQGWAVERWGYPKMLLADSAFGAVSIAVLPFIGRKTNIENSTHVGVNP